MRIGSLLVLLVVLGSLAGCGPTTRVESAAVPPMQVQMQTSTPFEKVVQMATMTPTFDLRGGTPTPTPITDLNGLRPTPTPFSLRDWGSQVTAYSDHTAGFAFECLSDWNVSPPSEDDRKNGEAYIITMRSSSPIYSRTNKDATPRMGVVEITVSNNGRTFTMEGAVEARKKEFQVMDPPWTVTSESLWTLPSGITVTRFDLDTPIGPARETVAIINGRRVLFTGTESLELFDAIAMSLQEE